MLVAPATARFVIASLLAGGLALAGVALPGPAGEAAAGGGWGAAHAPLETHCGAVRPALLVDTSASMAEHDPDRTLRVAVAAALGPVLPAAAAVQTFADGIQASAPPDGTPLVARVRGLLDAAVDDGPTELVGTLRAVARGGAVPGLLVLVTDAEPAEPAVLPVALRGTRFVVVTAGGQPPSGLRRLAERSGGAALGLSTTADASAVARAVIQAQASTCGRRSVGPVVLLSGLRDRAREVRGASTARGCAGGLSLALWCRELVAAGRQVWVPSIAPGRRLPRGGAAVIDSTGRLHPNATRLAAWVRRRVPGRPVYVGHSMGGLIAHAAISWSAAPAAGLVTVGTPHAGSFGADAYLAAKAGAAACILICPATAVSLALSAAGVRARFGAALDDLTQRRRVQLEPLPALPASVPLAAYAGAPNHVPNGLAGLLRRGERARRRAAGGGGYLLPNDGLVGVSSALAAGLRLHPLLTVEAGVARHSAHVLPLGAPTQLAGQQTALFVVDAVAQLAAGASRQRAGTAAETTWTAVARGRRARALAGGRAAAARRGAARTPAVGRAARLAQAAAARGRGRRTLNAGPRRIVVGLVPVRPLGAVPPGTTLTDLPERVVSVDPITLTCDGTPVAALAVADDLYVLDLAALGCSTAGLAPEPASALSPLVSLPGAPSSPLVSSPLGPALVSSPRAVALGPGEWSGAGSAGARVELLRRAGGAWRVTVLDVDRRPRARLAATAIALRRSRVGGPLARALAPLRATTGAYRGAIGPRQARLGGELTIAVAAADGSRLAGVVELG